MKNYLSVLGMLVIFSGGTFCSAADFDGDSRADIAVYRPDNGLWAVRGITRLYFGSAEDAPVADDFDGDGISDIAVFRESTGLWAVRDVTRIYFGEESDQPIRGGSGQRLSDYVVKESDGDDLVAALESGLYWNVFIPNGIYNVAEVINVNTLRVTGQDRVHIYFSSAGDYLNIWLDGCIIERLMVNGGGDGTIGAFHVQSGEFAVIRDCYSIDSEGSGFSYSSESSMPRLINCVAFNPTLAGFSGSTAVIDSQLISCSVRGAGGSPAAGFLNCRNLSGCTVRGENLLMLGFSGCRAISSSLVQACGSGFSSCADIASSSAVSCASDGFLSCYYLSACSVKGNSVTAEGFDRCHNLSSCNVQGCTGDEYSGCFNVSTASCD